MTLLVVCLFYDIALCEHMAVWSGAGEAQTAVACVTAYTLPSAAVGKNCSFLHKIR